MAKKPKMSKAERKKQLDLSNALLEAVRAGKLPEVRSLIEAGASPNAPNWEGSLPLHDAAEYGHLPVVKYLVEECHVAPDTINGVGDQPLHDAAEFGHLDIVKYLVEECHVSVSVTDSQGGRPLHDAAGSAARGLNGGGYLDVVKYLVGKGASVNSRDRSGWSPLHHAARWGNRFVAEFLVEKGARVDAVDDMGKQQPVHWAAKNGHLSMVKFLMEHGAGVDVKGNGDTPLHGAAENGHAHVVEFLMKKGANPQKKSKYGQTAFELAKTSEVHKKLTTTKAEGREEMRQADNVRAIHAHWKRMKGRIPVPGPRL